MRNSSDVAFASDNQQGQNMKNVNDRYSMASRVTRWARNNTAVVILLCVLVALALTMPQFFNAYNISSLLASPDLICIGLMAIGATYVISTGEIDLSMAGVCVTASIVAALLTPFGAMVAVAAAIAFGLLIGAVNGALVAFGRLPSFIVTLAMLMAMRGLALILAQRGRVPVPRDSTLISFQHSKIGVVPLVFLLFTAISLVSWVVFSKTRFGLHVVAAGGDQEAATMMGLRVPLIKFWVFVISGGLSGLAGALLLAKTTTGNPVEAQGWELTAIAAVILGGTLLTGGKGTITGTLAGVALLTLVFQILNYINGMGIVINTYMQNVIQGVFVLAVVVLQAWASINAENRQRKRVLVD